MCVRFVLEEGVGGGGNSAHKHMPAHASTRRLGPLPRPRSRAHRSPRQETRCSGPASDSHQPGDGELQRGDGDDKVLLGPRAVGGRGRRAGLVREDERGGDGLEHEEGHRRARHEQHLRAAAALSGAARPVRYRARSATTGVRGGGRQQGAGGRVRDAVCPISTG